jgi:hypothetical protein
MIKMHLFKKALDLLEKEKSHKLVAQLKFIFQYLTKEKKMCRCISYSYIRFLVCQVKVLQHQQKLEGRIDVGLKPVMAQKEY